MAINLDLLKALVAFQKYGTLSSTAEHLMITQPTVTRGMRRLEDELGVTLFDRRISNHIKLNDTGIFAASEASKLLKAESNFTERVLNYHHLNSELVIGSVAPGPIRLLDTIKGALDFEITINHQNILPEEVINDLQNFKEKLIFSDHEILTDTIESIYLGVEYLGIGIAQTNPLTTNSTVTFNDLANLSFLVLQDIGPWKKVVEDHIPHASFLYQADLDAMSEISQNSKLPFFFSNLTQSTATTKTRFSNKKRVAVPIDDPNNRIEFYGTYLKNNRKLVQPLLKKLATNWPE
ncbi:LysR family transcriptional regulator [Pediococcus acidilactici]|uniref:LysR family transcriptional regulator n=1 Tax=Pediococcus acidilactici TaxID=1254 RepID=UPI00132BD9E4|nr:LysR family transcriptional regulator [Pediococcus acidilactici]KAF0371943.1 LysR family transcriptional regulator [Pediococcus acidilactici]KAF0390915.1 LysR family transcriptional regulator [Pediococcus acidilactici]